ncbi:hypothetical protein [Hymenobacter sp. BT730]|uniref:hypothetical protein n=1 Tax=Hymenobacter sp. BT730 TaxID=3063332 RepID=UPI0026E02878|nr:hypothetical protein [Hymenobacter sp. BT730]
MHSVALLLFWMRTPVHFPLAEPPEWMTWWQAERPADAARTGGRTRYTPIWVVQKALEHPDQPERLARQQHGAATLATWLQALLAEGLPFAQYLFSSIWENQIAHLFEHELPGLGRALRQIAVLRHQPGPQALDDLLAALGDLYLLTQAFQHPEPLSPAEREDVRLRAGIHLLARERVLATQPGVADTWRVLARHTQPEERFGPWYHRRTWLWGQRTGRYALWLESDWNPPPSSSGLQPRGQYTGPLHFYPSAYPLRATLDLAGWVRQQSGGEMVPPGISPWQLAEAYAAALQQQPWLTEWPVTLGPVVPVLTSPTEVQLYHPQEQCLVPLHGPAQEVWQLLATSAGAPLAVFGEWNGQALQPWAHWAVAASPTELSTP